MQKKFAAGAMQQGEQELFLKLAGDPSGIFKLTGQDAAKMRMWGEEMKRDRERAYKLYNMQAPDIQTGKSAATSSLVGAPQPDIRNLEPVDPKAWRR